MSSTGGDADGGSGPVKLSSDGRYVAFQSDATNLVAGDTNGSGDVFLRDRQAATTSRVSVGSASGQGDAGAFLLDLSPDGRFVVFSSYATNLVPGDTNGQPDVFIRDVQNGTTEVVADTTGVINGSISADGRYFLFTSDDSALSPVTRATGARCSSTTRTTTCS